MIWHSDTVPVIRKHALKHGVWNKVVLTQPIQRKFQFAAKALCISLIRGRLVDTLVPDWLWAGVPVVTYAGTGMHQRVSASLLLSRFYRHKDQRGMRSFQEQKKTTVAVSIQWCATPKFVEL